jgi:hypothetical protein
MASPSDIRRSLPLLLSLNAGYVDTAGFLTLQGLFTVHVIGNFVTLGASLALNSTLAVSRAERMDSTVRTMRQQLSATLKIRNTITWPNPSRSSVEGQTC